MGSTETVHKAGLSGQMGHSWAVVLLRAIKGPYTCCQCIW